MSRTTPPYLCLVHSRPGTAAEHTAPQAGETPASALPDPADLDRTIRDGVGSIHALSGAAKDEADRLYACVKGLADGFALATDRLREMNQSSRSAVSALESGDIERMMAERDRLLEDSKNWVVIPA